MTNMLMNNTIKIEINHEILLKEIDISYFIHVHAYAYFARLRRGRFSRNRLASLDAPEKMR